MIQQGARCIHEVQCCRFHMSSLKVRNPRFCRRKLSEITAIRRERRQTSACLFRGHALKTQSRRLALLPLFTANKGFESIQTPVREENRKKKCTTHKTIYLSQKNPFSPLEAIHCAANSIISSPFRDIHCCQAHLLVSSCLSRPAAKPTTVIAYTKPQHDHKDASNSINLPCELFSHLRAS